MPIDIHDTRAGHRCHNCRTLGDPGFSPARHPQAARHAGRVPAAAGAEAAAAPPHRAGGQGGGGGRARGLHGEVLRQGVASPVVPQQVPHSTH